MTKISSAARLAARQRRVRARHRPLARGSLAPLGGHGIFTDYGLEQSETLANDTYKLMMTAAVDDARSTVVRCRRDEKRVLGDALSDVEKRIREIR